MSALDARYPTDRDFDFSSTNIGADSVYIRSNDSFWRKAGYNTSYGIAFVVGVKALTDNAQYSLLMLGPSKYQLNYTLANSTWQAGYFPYSGKSSVAPTSLVKYYKWYNWGGRNFKLNVGVTQGSVQVFLNTYSEMQYQSNGYLSIPLNTSNAIWTSQGTQSMSLI